MTMLALLSIPQAKARVQAMAESQKACYQFEYPRSFEMEAGKAGQVTIPIGADADFEQVAYNIAHNATGTDKPKILIKDQSSDSAEANDYVPLSLISTPGNSGIRFGERPFFHFYPAKTAIIIQWDATECVANVKVDFTARGWNYPAYRG